MISTKNLVKDNTHPALLLSEAANPIQPSVYTIAKGLKNARPNQFIQSCSTLPETVLLQLLDELKNLPPQSIFNLFIIRYELPINHYVGLRDLLYTYQTNDAVSLALLDLANTIPSNDQIQKLFLCFQDGYDNLLIRVMRMGSTAVIKKTVSIVLRFKPTYRDYLLTHLHVEYEKSSSSAASQVTGNVGRVSRVCYEGNAIDIAMERKQEPSIAQALVQTLHEYDKTCLIKYNVLEKALKHNHDGVVRLILEFSDLQLDLSKIDTIKTRYPDLKSEIIILLKASPLVRAIHKNIQTSLPNAVKDITQKTPDTLHSRWSSDNTLLHLATRKRHQDAISFLLSKNLPLNAVNREELTAFQMALNQGDTDIAITFVKLVQMQLRLEGSDELWPLKSVIQHNQSALTQTSLTMLSNAPASDVVFSSLAHALNAIDESTLHSSKTDALNQAMNEKHPDLSIADALCVCSDVANHAVSALIHKIATMYKAADHAQLNQAIDTFLTKQLHTLLESPSPYDQYSARIALIVFLFSQPTADGLVVLKQLSFSARQRSQLELVLAQALRKPVIYSKLSYEEHKAWLSFFEIPSESFQCLVSWQLEQCDLTLLPTALLLDYSKDSTFDFLYEISQRRIHPVLMILTLEKGLQTNGLDATIQESLQQALEQELIFLSSQSPEASIRQLNCILNLITHPDLKVLVQARLFNTPLQTIPATLFLNFTENAQLTEHSLLWDLFLTFSKNPKQVIESNAQKSLAAFIRQLSASDAILLINNYLTLLEDPDTSFRQKLHQSVVNGLLSSQQMPFILPLLFQWSIAYSRNAAIKDELIDQMPYLLETLPTSAWEGIDEMLLNTSNSYIASLKLLKDGLMTKDDLSVSGLLNIWPLLKDGVSLRHDASVLFVTSLLPLFQDNLLSEGSQVAIETIVRLFSFKLYTEQFDVIDELPESLVTLLFEHALNGIASEDYNRVTTCEKLLNCIAYACAADNKTHLSVIKKRLGQQDLSILHDPQLIEMARSILSTRDTNLEEETYDGVWIQRLITSVDFISSITPDTLHQLVERYRLLSLSLKQDEFDNLNRWISGRFLHANHYSDALKRVRLEMIQDPIRRHHLLAKRQRLLEFRVDDSIRALFNQLEDTCLQLKSTQTTRAEKALTTLCSYYNQRLSGLRTDNLFKLSNIVFARVRRGDVHLAQSTLMQWLARYLPHLNFEQSELERKINIYLYDNTGKKIGFINELNQAMAFVNDEPCPLLKVPGMTTDRVLYDESRRRVGVLTKTSDVQYENVFQKNTSALMIAKVPQECLLQSPQALNLLLQDVWHHGEIDTLYHCIEKAEELDKRLWVTSLLDTQFVQNSKNINPSAIDRFVAFHSNESVLALLQKTENAHNAAAVFHSILQQDDKRTALFQQGTSSVTGFLNRFKPVEIFTNFLIQHHNAPWFHQGLQLFLQATPSKTKRAALLLEALQLAGENRDSIMHALIATETNSRLLLNAFLSDDASTSIQAARTTTLDAITACVSIEHIKRILPLLNKAHHLLTQAQYRFVLMAIDAHFDNLFPARELRLSETESWHMNDLIELTRLAKRHWNEGRSIDTQRAIGKKLLGELALRTANFGQTNIFYTESGRFDVPMAQFSLSRSVMSTLLSRTIPHTLMERIKIALGVLDVTHWFDKKNDDTRELSAFLEKEGALIDWRKMSNQSWELSDDTKLPLISAFLLNYSGSTALADKLIQDFFDSSTCILSKTNQHHVTQLISVFPNRDISRLIFKILKARIIETPALLDETTLNHMAVFYTVHELKLKKDTELTARHLALIKFFGQQKQYDVVLTLCRLMPKSGSHTKLLKQIKTEARVERELAPLLNEWYFPILVFFKRGWNYWGKKSSSYVSFCDKEATNLPLKNVSSTIRTHVLGGDEVTTQLTQHQDIIRTKAIQVRLKNVSPQTVMVTSSAYNPDVKPKLSDHGLFTHVDDCVVNPIHESFIPIECS